MILFDTVYYGLIRRKIFELVLRKSKCNNPANIYLFKSTTETLEKGVKYVQS